eukprot:GAHX01001995.1.p1 GENE.GAHX01001995.1~~GAHX01001995.1.p1  ORF type:complete len:444 (-),score=118.72 GAHX01001995.1:30-1361(-)
MPEKTLPSKQKIKYEFALENISVEFKEKLFTGPLAVRWLRKNNKVHKRNKIATTKYLNVVKSNNNWAIHSEEALKQKFALIFDPKISHFTHKTNEIQILMMVNNKEKVIISVRLELHDFIDLYEIQGGEKPIEKIFGSYDNQCVRLVINSKYRLTSSKNSNIEKIVKFFQEDKHLTSPKPNTKTKSKKNTPLVDNNFGNTKYKKDVDYGDVWEEDIKKSKQEEKEREIFGIKERISALDLTKTSHMDQYIEFAYNQRILITKIDKIDKRIETKSRIVSRKKLETLNKLKREIPAASKLPGERVILERVYEQHKTLTSTIKKLKEQGNKEENLVLLRKELNNLEGFIKEFKIGISLLKNENEKLSDVLNSYELQKRAEEVRFELETLKENTSKLDEQLEKQDITFKKSIWNVVDEKTNLREKQEFKEKIEAELIEAKMKLASIL